MTRYVNLRPWEVLAFLAGRKTQIGRVLEAQPLTCHYYSISVGGNFIIGYNVAGSEVCRSKLPFSPGDVLLCRETFAIESTYEYEGEPGIVKPEGPVQWVENYDGVARYRLIPRYKATAPDTLLEITGEGEDSMRWSSPVVMPSWAVRIKLRVTAVRVERVQEISEEDAEKEGIEIEAVDQTLMARNYLTKDEWFNGWTEPGYVDVEKIARASYRSLWESINGPGAWERNDWVCVGEIEREEG